MELEQLFRGFERKNTIYKASIAGSICSHIGAGHCASGFEQVGVCSICIKCLLFRMDVKIDIETGDQPESRYGGVIKVLRKIDSYVKKLNDVIGCVHMGLQFVLRWLGDDG